MSQVTLICDLGGVFVRLCYLSIAHAFHKLGIEEFDSHYSQLVKSFLFFEFETGKIDESNFRIQLREYFNIKPEIMDEAIDDAWNALLAGVDEEALRALESLKAHNIRLILFSNNNPLHKAALAERYPNQWQRLQQLFDKLYFSHEFGYRKPNKESFIKLLEAEGCTPGLTYFVDDSLAAVIGALKSGMHAFQLDLSSDMTFAKDAKPWIEAKLQALNLLAEPLS